MCDFSKTFNRLLRIHELTYSYQNFTIHLDRIGLIFLDQKFSVNTTTDALALI